MNTKTVAIVALVAALAPLAAQAQSVRYDVKTINYDMWCQEQAKLPPERCDKRLPEDEKQFEAYRAKIEKYEVPYLKQKEEEEQFDRTVLHADPVDNPVDKNAAAQSQASQPGGDSPNPQ